MAQLTIRSDAIMKGVDPRLVDIITRAAAAAGPNISHVEIISGKNARAYTGNHPSGRAIDVQLYDADGKPIYNEPAGKNPFLGDTTSRTAQAFSAYQAFANVAKNIQESAYPGLDSAFAWGGYFGPDSHGKNAADLMHFDISGMRGSLGNWQGGLNKTGLAFLPGATNAALGKVGPIPPLNVGQTAQGRDMPLGRGKGRISSGFQVATWQAYLKSQGLYNGKLDGQFGTKTLAATRAYQRSVGVTPDGVVGDQTRSANAPGNPMIPPTSGSWAARLPDALAIARSGIPSGSDIAPSGAAGAVRPIPAVTPFGIPSGAVPSTVSPTSVRSPSAVDWYRAMRPATPAPAAPVPSGPLPMQQGFNQRQPSPVPAAVPATGPGGAPLAAPGLRGLFESIPGYKSVEQPLPVAPQAGNSAVPFGWGPAPAKPVGQPTPYQPDFEGESQPTSVPSSLAEALAARAAAPTNVSRGAPAPARPMGWSTSFVPDFEGESSPVSAPSALIRAVGAAAARQPSTMPKPPSFEQDFAPSPAGTMAPTPNSRFENDFAPSPMGTVNIPKGMSSLIGAPSGSSGLPQLASTAPFSPSPSLVRGAASLVQRPQVIPTSPATAAQPSLGGFPMNVTPAGGPSPLDMSFALPGAGGLLAPNSQNDAVGAASAPQYPVLSALKRAALPAAASVIAGPAAGAVTRLIQNLVNPQASMSSGNRGGIGSTNGALYAGSSPNTNSYAQAYTAAYGGSSPYVPAGWTAPTFDPVNGGSVYAYKSNGDGTGVYMTGNGTIFSYN